MQTIKRAGIPFIVGVGMLFAVSAIADITPGNSTTATSTSVSSNDITLAKPSGTVEGDFLLAGIALDDGTPSLTAPSGWTPIARTNNDVDASLASYYKVAGASEPSSYTWTITPSAKGAGGITRYEGVRSFSPIGAFGSSTGSGSVASVPAITTTATNTQVVALYTVNAGGAGINFSTTSGMTERYEIKNATAGPTLSAQGKLQVTPGSSGTVFSTSTAGAARMWVAQLLALIPSTPLQSGLVSYWKLDESSGNADDSFSSNDLTNNNSISYTAAQINNGADLNGSSQYFSIADGSQSGLDFSSEMSAAFWIKLDSEPTQDGGWAGLIGKDSNADTDERGYDFYYIKAAGSSGDGANVLRFYAFDHSGSHQRRSVIQTLATSTWYHIAVTWDGTQSQNSRIKIYVNGTENTNEGSETAGDITTINDSTGPFMIGAEPFVLGTNRYKVDGVFDEVGIWDRALTAQEVSDLYNSGSGLSYPF
ncbi:LamG domain-containing protein [Candidatus Parcubacteria bacterium]|nr:LamG domain-containing protein [Candidatus Parcubacteria bacterium]